MTTANAVIRVEGIRKHYGRTVAIEDVTFEVYQGEIFGLIVAGKRVFAGELHAPFVAFSLAVLFSTVSILSIGFVLASVVPAARFAQPIGALIFYPMLAFSGLFFPLEAMSPTLRLIARALPLTHAVSLMRGIWRGDGWIAHGWDAAALALVLVVCTALSAKVFRWE
jgi:ABC-2 type transport system permease protein